jgi:hypothetical protein
MCRGRIRREFFEDNVANPVRTEQKLRTLKGGQLLPFDVNLPNPDRRALRRDYLV